MATQPQIQEVETLVHGPVPFTDWPKRERERRRIVLQLFFKVAVLMWFVMVIPVYGPELTPVVLTCAAVMGFLFGRAVFVVATEGPDEHIQLVLFAGLGVLATTGLYYGQNREVALLGYPTLLTLAALGPFDLFATGFAEWCCCVPDRDIMVRRHWRGQWKRLAEGRAVGLHLNSIMITMIAGMVPVVAALVTFFLAGSSTTPLEQCPSCLWSAFIALFLMPPGVFVVGCISAAFANAGGPIRLLSVSWRAVVLGLTYNLADTGGKRAEDYGTYQYPKPFTKPPLRRFLVATLLLLATVAAVSALQWPPPFEQLGLNWQTFPEYNQLLAQWILPAMVKVFLLTLAIPLWLFLVFAGAYGPVLTLYYRELAENAVNVAERTGHHD